MSKRRKTHAIASFVLLRFLSSFVNEGQGNKIVLKNFSREPVVVETATYIEIKQGDPCDADTDAPPSAANQALAFGIPFVMGQVLGLPTTAVAFTAGMAAFGWGVQAQATSECASVPIEVEIYVEATVEEVVNKMYNAGTYEDCPPESKFGYTTLRPLCAFVLLAHF